MSKGLEPFTKPMDFVPYAFVGCLDDDHWHIFHMNGCAKESFVPAGKAKVTSLYSVFGPGPLAALRRAPDNVVVLGRSKLDGLVYSMQSQRAVDPKNTTTPNIRWIAIRQPGQLAQSKSGKAKIPTTVIPDLYTSMFCAKDVLRPKLTIDDVNFKGRRVIMRVDYNVPMNRDHTKIVNDFRIQSTLPSVRKILADEPKYLVLVSHWGQPKTAQYDAKFSLKPVAAHLQALIGAATPVIFAPDCMNAEEALAKAPPKSIVLLENVRFAPGENSTYLKAHGKEAKRALTTQLSGYADIYVNDAFGAAHRGAVSIVDLPQRIRISVAGKLLAKEMQYLTTFMQNPVPPVMAVIGGAKVTDKIKLLRKLAESVDYIAIGGAMAIPFLKAQGVPVGKSLIEKNAKGVEIAVDIANNLLKHVDELNRRNARKVEILLPVDHAVSPAFRNLTPTVTDGRAIPKDMMALDIGPKTVELWRSRLMTAKTILWMGPVGVFEFSNYKDGSVGIARAIGAATEKARATSVIGGGETVTVVDMAGAAHKMSHVSTGGGATLALLEGQALPGVVHLTTKTQAKL